MGVVLLLTILGSTLLLRTLHENQLSTRSSAQQGAMSLAEASIDRTLCQLRVGQFTDLATTSLGGGNYSAEVAPAGPPLRYRVTGHGLSVAEKRNLEALVQLTKQSVFQGALFGNTSLTVSGTVVTNSYDSRVAPYNAATAGSNGDVGTNSGLAGAVNITGSIAINGQVMVGAGTSDPNAVVTIAGGTAIITGSPPVAPLQNNIIMSPVSPPAGMPCPDLTITNAGQDPNLAPGVYCYHNVSVSGGGSLTTNDAGSVTVFVTGAFSASGHTVVGVEANPTQFLMVLTATAGELILEGDFTGTTEFYGGIYAPTGEIKIAGSAAVFGSVVADTINLTGNAQVHYDKAMGALEDPTGGYQTALLSWQEL